jgi:outer membrane protein assembly factor BamB
VAGGLAVFGGCDGLLHVVDLAEGRQTTTIDAGTYIAASAVMAGGLVYVGNVEGMLMCANPVTRWPQWKYTPEGCEFFASPAVGATALYVGSRDKRLHAVDRKFGDPLWTFATRGDVDSSPVLVGEKVVFGSGDGRLYMVRASDGRQVWAYDVGSPILASPAVAGRRVVVGADDGTVYCFGPAK